MTNVLLLLLYLEHKLLPAKVSILFSLVWPAKPDILVYSYAVPWYYHISTKKSSRRPCRKEVCHSPAKACAVLAVSSCLSAGMHPLAPGLLLPCLSRSPPLIFSSAPILIHFSTPSSSPNLTWPYGLNGIWTSRDFSWHAQCRNLWVLLEMALLLHLTLCLFYIFLCRESDSCRSTTVQQGSSFPGHP